MKSSKNNYGNEDDKYPYHKILSTIEFPYLNELYFPKPTKNIFLYNFIRKYLLVEYTLKNHNIMIHYSMTGDMRISHDDIYKNTSIFYDNNYLSNIQKKNFQEQLNKIQNNEDKKKTYNLFSYMYVLSDECINEFNHLDRDEQIANWLKIKAHLPVVNIRSSINKKCSELIKTKLMEMNGVQYTMSKGDHTSIFVEPPKSYRFGKSSNKMHICFNDELSYNVKLYFEAIKIFHDFYKEHMSTICYYKVIGGINLRDTKENVIQIYNDYNRKMPNIAIYLHHIEKESEIIEYGEKFRSYFNSKWKHKIIPFTKSKLLFNNPINKKINVDKGKYFIQYTSGASGDTKLECIGEIIRSQDKCVNKDAEFAGPHSICYGKKYKIKPGITIKKYGEHFRVNCDKSPRATRKECKKNKKLNKSIGRIINTKCGKDKYGENKNICYDELCFY